VQFIQPDGSKRFKTGGAVAGCYCALGGKPGPDAPLLICEGWATACSLHEATGYPVAAAMNAGNLLAVAQAMRAKLPDATMVVCADDDNKSDGNPGLTKAREAANAIGAGLAVPDFGAERPEDATDFNDLHVMRGTNAVRACIDAAREPPENAGEPTVGDDLSFPGLNERPCWRVYEGCGNGTGRKIKPGVYWHGVKPGINDAPSVPIDKWICTPMTVTAVTRNREDAEYGRLLEILSPTGRRKKWAMPMSMLAGDGSEARAVLLAPHQLTFDACAV
jgi:putative DNA primase/helicase